MIVWRKRYSWKVRLTGSQRVLEARPKVGMLPWTGLRKCVWWEEMNWR